MKDWIKTSSLLPPEGKVVSTMDSGGSVQLLKRRKGLWFFPDDSMYVYYVPSFWQEVN